MALTDNILGYWKTDETSGTSAADATGNGFTGTLQTNASFVSTGKINYGLQSATSLGTTGGITLGAPAGLDISQYPLTFAGWFKTSANGTQSNSTMTVISCSKSSSNYSGVSLYMMMGTTVADRGKIRWNYRNVSGTDYNVTTTTQYNDGNWHHAVGTISSGGAMKLYIDGSLVASGATATSTLFTSTKAWRIGTNWDLTASNVWVGSLDEVAVWTRELSSTEVTELYNGGTGFQYPFVSTSFIPRILTS